MYQRWKGNQIFCGVPVKLDLYLLWTNKFILVFAGLVGLGMGWAYLLCVPTTYEAQARVLIEPRRVSADSGPIGRVVPEFIPTQAETIRSPLTIAQAVQSIQIAPPDGVSPEDFDPVRHVLKSLNVTPLLNANVVTISYRSNSKSESTELISSIVAAYESFVNQIDKGTSDTRLQLIVASEKKLREELRSLEKDYENLRTTNPGIGQGRTANQDTLIELELLNRQFVTMTSERQEIETSLGSFLKQKNGKSVSGAMTSAQLAQISFQTRLPSQPDQLSQDIDLTLKKPSLSQTPENKLRSEEYPFGDLEPSGLAQPVIYADSNQIEQIILYSNPDNAREILRMVQDYQNCIMRVNQLDHIFSPRHPELISAYAQVDQSSELLRQRFDNVVRSWQRKLIVLLAKQAEIEKQISCIKDEIKATGIYQVREENLLSNIKNLRLLHGSTLQQLITIQEEESAISNGRNSIEIKMIDRPMILEDMTWPNPKLILCVSPCLGLLIGIGFVGTLQLRKHERQPVDQTSVNPDSAEDGTPESPAPGEQT